ncbi:MAG: prolipoprotein diacylglyceryl transferase [Candidatus Woesearchaeota archaeon]
MSSGIAFTIFGIDVFWYGIMYAVGFLLAYLYFQKYFNSSLMTEDNKDTAFIIMALSSLLGGRLFYTLVYSPSYYLQNPLDILRVMDGGMSIHGGLIGFVVGCYIVSRKYNLTLYKITDFFMLPAILAMAFGRLGNFINQELPGIPTNSMFGVVFSEVDNLNRFPYQLFAGFSSLIIFHVILYIKMFRTSREGVLTYLTIFLYSITRFFLDFMREPTTLFLNFPVGQWLSLVLIIVTGYMLYRLIILDGKHLNFKEEEKEEERGIELSKNNLKKLHKGKKYEKSKYKTKKNK